MEDSFLHFLKRIPWQYLIVQLKFMQYLMGWRVSPFSEYIKALECAYMGNEFEKFKEAFNSHDRIIILGNGGRCSFSLDHKIVPEHRLHIFYYNFPELGKNTSKTTKSIINKINQIYDTYINKTDNILIIIGLGLIIWDGLKVYYG